MVTRTPVWKQKRITSALIRMLLRPIRYSWPLALLQAAFLISASYWFQRPPSSGVAVVILTVLAIVMAIRAEDKWGRLERAGWLSLIAIVSLVAIRAVKEEDAQREKPVHCCY